MDLISQPFDGFISSPECDQLTNFITPQIKQNLKLQRFSKTHYQYHLSKILLNLYQAWSSHPDKCVGISRRKNYYDSLGIYRNRKLSTPAYQVSRCFNAWLSGQGTRRKRSLLEHLSQAIQSYKDSNQAVY